jgi:uncharacterized protein (DUF58 family)
MSGKPSMPVEVRRIPSLFADPLTRVFLWILLFVALLFGRTDLSAFCLIMLLLSSGAKLWLRLGAGGVASRFTRDRLRVMPGEPLSFALEVWNRSVLPMAVRSRLTGAGGFSGDCAGDGPRVSTIGGRRRKLLRWSFKAPGRGVYGIGPPVTEAGDVLGLFFRETTRGKALELVVYPRLFRIGSFSRQSRELFGSIRADGLIEDPVNSMGTREYHPGRPARAIHWKASARMSRLQEKVFEPSRRARVVLSIDVGGFCEAGDEDGFEEMLEAAASIAVHLAAAGVAVGMITNAGMKGGASPLVLPSQDPGHLATILEGMARMTMEPAADLEVLAGRVLPRGRGVGCLHFVREIDGGALAFESYAIDRRSTVTFVAARRDGSKAFALSARGGVVFADTLRGAKGGAAA